MHRLIALFLFSLICNISHARDFYFSSTTGSDSYSITQAQNQATPWKSIAKLNSFFSSLLPGDNVYFKRGEEFYGSIIKNKSGISGNPITIGAYGIGAKPIITGFTTISGWTNEGGGIYSKIIIAESQTNMVTIDGNQYAMGRFPDSDFLTYESFSTNTSITDNTLGSSPNWTGAEVAIKKNDWTLDRCAITNHTLNTLTYTNKGTDQNATANFGYFIQNDLRTLTTYGEWYHDVNTGKFYMYFGSVLPSTKVVKVATINSLITNSSSIYDNITIDNINLTGSIGNAINFNFGNDYCVIQNCDISFVGKIGIFFPGSDIGSIIDNNSIRFCNNNGIICGGINSNITNNTISNIANSIGQGLGIDGSHDGIGVAGNGSIVRYNIIRNIAGSGIVLKYTGAATIQYNLIDSVCTLFDDGAGIYTSGPNTNVRLIEKNIITNIIGNSSGTITTTSLSSGIFLDEFATNVKVINNSIENSTYVGIKLHKSNNNIIRENTTFNTGRGIYFQNTSGATFINNIMVGNIFFAKTASQYPLQFYSLVNDITSLTADSNYYLRPIDDKLTITYQQPSTRYYYLYTDLAGWQTFSKQDANSKKSPKTIANVSQLIFQINPSISPKTISFPGLSYIDSKGIVYNNSATIPAWASIALIANGTATTTNKNPIANAGPDKIVITPSNNITLTGSGTDSDGIISSYAWTKIAGPTAGTIATPTSATTIINNLVQGVYQFELSVTDNSGAVGKDTVIVTVNAYLLPALYPANTVNGLDYKYYLGTWSLLPAFSSLTSVKSGIVLNFDLTPTTQSTLFAFSFNGFIIIPTDGFYTFFTTSDDGSNLFIDNVLTVANDGIHPPVEKSGIIGLQAGLHSIRGEFFQNAGGQVFMVSYQGTGIAKQTIPASILYRINNPPIVNAGVDQTITLPVNSVSLSGIASDNDGTISNYTWTKITGPAAGTIATPTVASTAINSLVEGAYQFELTVTDNNGAVGKDTVNLIVNTPPIANAGVDRVITLPTNSLTLTGSGISVYSTIRTYTWNKTAGPAVGTIASPIAAVTALNSLVQGIYQFELTVTDYNGAVGKDTIFVTVNNPPVANAGSDKTISLPINATTLNGVGTDIDGNISSFAWAKIAGPSKGLISLPTSANTSLSNLVQGAYQFEFTVTDNNGAIAKDTINVIVNATPLSNAGTDNLITLPTNTTTLTGSGTDSDGIISSYAWIKIAGPTAGTIATPTSATTIINNLVQGVYQFELSVTDNSGAVGKDTVIVTVNAYLLPALYLANTVNGLDYKYYLGTWSLLPAFSSLTSVKSGIVLNFDLTPTTQSTLFAFSFNGFINIPTDGFYTFFTTSDDGSNLFIDNVLTVANDGIHPPVEKSGIIGLQAGLHSIRGEFFQNAGGQVFIVNYQGTGIAKQTIPASILYRINNPPIVNAGVDQTITLPVNSVSLSGIASDNDGTISNYTWTKITGPAAGTIATPTVASTAINSLVEGTYQFELTVTDNNGATAKDIVQITVISNLLPSVNPSNTVSGLDYKYYEGTWTLLPVFNALTPVKSGSVLNFDLSIANRTTLFACSYDGLINVPSDGFYTFFTTSDDGSSLSIDNVLVVSNDGIHPPTEKSGIIGLKAGKHYIRGLFFQNAGGQVFTVSYQSPSITKQLIPASSLSRVSASSLARSLQSVSVSRIITQPSTPPLSEFKMYAYPNPSNNEFTLYLKGIENEKVDIIVSDVFGNVVYKIKALGNSRYAFGRDLKAGIYFVKLKQGSKLLSEKIIKTN